MGSTLEALAARLTYGTDAWKAPVRAVSTSNLSLSGLVTVDGVALQEGDRVLAAGQTNAAHRGVYIASSGPWKRSDDFIEDKHARLGTTVKVLEGTLYAGSEWMLTSPTIGTIKLNVTNLTFTPEASGVPANATIVPASGDTTGATDSVAIAIVLAAGRIAVLTSGATYYDNGTAFTWSAGSGVVTTDERPAFWAKGSAATTHMTAMPSCVSTIGTSVTFRLPPAARWKDQYITCEQTAATSATVDPDGSETIGVDSTRTVSGVGDRLVLHSRGTSVILPLTGGTTTNPVTYGNKWVGLGANDFELIPGAAAGSPRELYNYMLRIGDLRASESFIKGTAIVGYSLDNVNLFDWQMFGSGSATGFLYWREAYNTIGWRVQAISTSASKGLLFSGINGGAPVQVELGANTSPFYATCAAAGFHAIEILGIGDHIQRSGAGRTHSIRPGVGTVYDIDWQTASSAGLEQKRHQTDQTSDATPKIIPIVLSPTDNRTIRVAVEILAYHASNAAGYTLSATFRKVGGTLTQVGSTTQSGVHENTAGMDATLSVDSGNIVATVTGVAAITIRWELYSTTYYGQA